MVFDPLPSLPPVAYTNNRRYALKLTDEAERARARRYYIRRAQTRKASREVLKRAFDQMDRPALWGCLFESLDDALAVASDGTNRELVYAIRTAMGAGSELMLRGEQLSLDV